MRSPRDNLTTTNYMYLSRIDGNLEMIKIIDHHAYCNYIYFILLPSHESRLVDREGCDAYMYVQLFLSPHNTCNSSNYPVAAYMVDAIITYFQQPPGTFTTDAPMDPWILHCDLI